MGILEDLISGGVGDAVGALRRGQLDVPVPGFGDATTSPSACPADPELELDQAEELAAIRWFDHGHHRRRRHCDCEG